MTEQQTLVAIDGTNLLLRAWFQASRLSNEENKQVYDTIRLYGNWLRKIKQIEQPNFGYIAWDATPGEQTFRGRLSADYKKNRERGVERPPILRTLTQVTGMCYGFSEGSAPNFEADDIIGTLAHLAHKDGIHTVIYSSDKDLLQLVRDDCTVVRMITGMSNTRRYDPARLTKEFDVQPEQFVDYKALVGDSSDNYPGVKGIGPKTAARLLHKYANLDEIFAHLADVSPKNRKLLETNQENGRLSFKLAQLNCHVPFADWVEQFPLLPTDNAKFQTLLNSLKKKKSH